MIILGINCYGHDTAAALLVDGRITQFHEEERFNRQKHTRLYPYRAINFCLAMNQGGKDSVDFVAYPFRISGDVEREIKKLADDTGRGESGWLDWGLGHFEKLKAKVPIVRDQLGVQAPSKMIGHHESHMASAFFCSPFERAAILSIDGVGDLVTTMFGVGEGTRLSVLKTIQHPHGIGYLYTAITQYLGFTPTSDEGKVMGLAPYGRPTLREAFERLVTLDDQGTISLNLDYFWHNSTLRQLNPKMTELIGPPREPGAKIEERHEDIAYCLQERSEQAYFHHLNYLHELTGCDNLCLAGGVTLNSCANGKIRDNTPFKNIFIPPFVHDAGTAIGAAQWIYHHELGNPRINQKNLAYLGYEPGVDEIEKALLDANVGFRKVKEPWKETTSLLADGKIVAWYQRRTEGGPRALGNRSILADPRREEMKDLLNARVKFREGFRPFAPAVLLERVNDYFEYDKSEPYMLQVYPVRRAKRGIIPAVTHVDGTGRLQTVAKSDNPQFYNLISEFEQLTGVPVVLNTSFNVMGEPIVNRPEEAIQCFLKSGIDVLVIGECMVVKTSRSEMKKSSPENWPKDIKNRFIERAYQRILQDGHKTLALYGAGQHSKRLIDTFKHDDRLTITALLDDTPVASGEKYGLPVMKPQQFSEEVADAVLLSSDAFEDKLWEASEPLREKGLSVYRIYAVNPDYKREIDEHGHDSYEDIFSDVAQWNPEAYHMRDGLSEENAVIYHRYSRKHIHDALYRVLERYMPKDGKLLDVGSGRGWDTHRMSKRFPKADITGMEYAPKGVEISKQYEGPRLHFTQGDATAMPFDDDVFDAAYSLATVEHVAEPESMIKEIYRVLKPGGFCLLATHPGEYWRFWLAHQAAEAKKSGEEMDFHGLEIDELAQMLSVSGFEPVEHECVAFVFPQMWLKHFQGIDFKKFFALQALVEWIYRGVGYGKRLYYQYHIVRKPGGVPLIKYEPNPILTTLHRILATPLFWLIEPMVKAARDRCAKLD